MINLCVLSKPFFYCNGNRDKNTSCQNLSCMSTVLTELLLEKEKTASKIIFLVFAVLLQSRDEALEISVYPSMLLMVVVG